jgi:hypothetical protein
VQSKRLSHANKEDVRKIINSCDYRQLKAEGFITLLIIGMHLGMLAALVGRGGGSWGGGVRFH